MYGLHISCKVLLYLSLRGRGGREGWEKCINYRAYIVTSPPIGGGRGIVMPMSVCLFVCVFVCLCVCLFVCVFVCLSVFSQNFKV